jgi:hypothetical protein
MGHNDDIPPPDDDAVVESSEDLPHHPHHHHHHPSSGGASTDDGGVEEDTTADGAFCVLFRCLYCGSRRRLVHVDRAFTQYPCRFTLCLPLTKNIDEGVHDDAFEGTDMTDLPNSHQVAAADTSSVLPVLQQESETAKTKSSTGTVDVAHTSAPPEGSQQQQPPPTKRARRQKQVIHHHAGPQHGMPPHGMPTMGFVPYGYFMPSPAGFFPVPPPLGNAAAGGGGGTPNAGGMGLMPYAGGMAPFPMMHHPPMAPHHIAQQQQQAPQSHHSASNKTEDDDDRDNHDTSNEQSNSDSVDPSAASSGGHQHSSSLPSGSGGFGSYGPPMYFPPPYLMAQQQMMLMQQQQQQQHYGSFQHSPPQNLTPPHQQQQQQQQQQQPPLRYMQPSQGIVKSLSLQCDVEHLSDYQILVRQQLELFEADANDVECNTQGRKKPVTIRQVGLRCRHCAMTPYRHRGRGAVYYPAKLDGVYQAAQNMAGSHLCKPGVCPHLPPLQQQQLKELRARRDNASGGKQYWADGCRALGLMETAEHGLRFAPSSTTTDSMSGPSTSTRNSRNTAGTSERATNEDAKATTEFAHSEPPAPESTAEEANNVEATSFEVERESWV